MLRLNQADFDDPHELAKLAATAGISIDEFKDQFYYLIENDLLYKFIREGKIELASQDSNWAYNPPVASRDAENELNGQEMLPNL
jgi:6-phosphofructokinase 1